MDAAARALKEIGDERGRKAEDKFFAAMRRSSSLDMPPWFLRACRPSIKGNKKEDRVERKDAIIKTKDVGDLFVQIKSSQAGKRKCENDPRNHPNKPLIIVVVHDHDTFEDIIKNTRRLLSKLRQDILDKRNVTKW